MKLATDVGRTKLTTLATVDVLWQKKYSVTEFGTTFIIEDSRISLYVYVLRGKIRFYAKLCSIRTTISMEL